MSMFKNVKGIQMFMSLSLIITFTLLINLPARAENIEQDFFTFGPVSFVPLLAGQNYTISLTAPGPFGFHTVGIISFGNPTASIQIQSMDDEAFGYWLTTIVGTGGRNFFDMTNGFWPYNGNAAQIDVSKALSFSVGTATYFITSPGTAEFPLKYKVKVGQ